MSSIHSSVADAGLSLLFACLLNVAAASAQVQQTTPSPPSTETLHNELRALKDRAVTAVNKRDPDALMKELSSTIIFTAMNNEVVHGLDQAKAYYQRMLVGAGRIVEDMSITVEPDDLTVLNDSGTTGISAGSSNAHFKLATGNEFDVPLRWSATLQRSNEKWSIVSLHFSADMFDNPTLDALKSSTMWIALGSALVAIFLGFFVGRWSRKRSV